MKATTSLAALALGMLLAGAALAQSEGGTAGQQAPAPSTADVGTAAGAAAETMGQQLGEIRAQVQPETPAEVPAGTTTLPNGMDITPVEMVEGRWTNADGIPVPKIAEDGTTDYATFSGFRRYHAECHVCHGPDGEGSTYAPALKTTVLNMDYYDFLEIAASGKQEVNVASNQVMPAFGTNKNAWCYINDIYVYLLARGTDAIPRGRPAKKEAKSDEFTAQEDDCMSM